jgi:hypothetical protein
VIWPINLNWTADEAKESQANDGSIMGIVGFTTEYTRVPWARGERILSFWRLMLVNFQGIAGTVKRNFLIRNNLPLRKVLGGHGCPIS